MIATLRFAFIVSLFGCLLSSPQLALAELLVEPHGMAFSVEQGGELESTFTLSNTFEEPVVFKISMTTISEPEGRDAAQRDLRSVRGLAGPVRDGRGGPDELDYEWRDDEENDGPEYEWIERGAFAENQVRVLDWGQQDDANSGAMDLGFVMPFYGNEYQTIRMCTNGWASFTSASARYNFDQGQFQIPGGDIENMLAVAATDWYPRSGGGTYWFGTDGEIAVCAWEDTPHINHQGQDNIRWSFQIQLNSTGRILFMYHPRNFEVAINRRQIIGFQDANRQLGFQIYADIANEYPRPENGRAIVLGPSSALVTWLRIDENEGELEAGAEIEIPIMVIPEEAVEGTHELLLTIVALTPEQEDQDQVELGRVEFTALMTVNSPVGNISGQVIGARSEAPIEGVRASLGEYNFVRNTDGEGMYEMANLPEGAYVVTFTAPDYLPATEEVDLGEDGLELNIALLHAECNLSGEQIDFELAPETDSHVDFTVSNDGNGPLTYTIDRRLLGDANAAPWEVRQTYDFGNIVEDDRVEGVAFDGEFFYLSGADGDNANTIYVLNRDLEIVRQFNQPGESRYGMKDLEWDGELLWGSGETRVFGFDTEGNVEHQFQSPFNPTNCIAWDSDRQVLWISSTTSDMHAYTREGQATGARILRRGLRIYGLAYWPDDPDGHPLYVFNSPAGGQLVVHKIDPENGDTLRARNLEVPEGAAAGGAFICNTFDVYSWVLMAVNSIAPNLGGDRVNILQLGARKEWFLVDPGAGVIEAGEEQEFDLHLNATGLPPVMFQGELVFLHDGVGSETHLPINLDVVEGPVHSIRNIPLNMGWNIVSANLQPDEDNFRAIMAGLVEEGVLSAVKDDGGHFYLPASDFSNLGGWLVSEGYWVKVTRAAEFSVEGMTVMSDDPIDLVQGWQAVSYYPRRAVDAMIALSGIVENLIVAKDAAGNFYLPEFGFSNMVEMDELKGYQLKMSEATELVYRTRMEGVAGLAKSTLQADPKHFVLASRTGQNMSLLLRSEVRSQMSDVAEIGVFTESGLLVGSSTSSSSSTGLAVWGDDPTTDAIDGAVEGEKLIIKVWDGSSEAEASTRVIRGDLTYSTDDYAVIEVTGLKAETPVSFGLTGAYPNPFNARLTAGFDLPEAGLVKLSLYDLSGREVAGLVNAPYAAGRHSVALSGESLASGVYLLRLEAAGKTSQMKVALVK